MLFVFFSVFVLRFFFIVWVSGWDLAIILSGCFFDFSLTLRFYLFASYFKNELCSIRAKLLLSNFWLKFDEIQSLINFKYFRLVKPIQTESHEVRKPLKQIIGSVPDWNIKFIKKNSLRT